MPFHTSPELQGELIADCFLPGQLPPVVPGLSYPWEHCGELPDDEATPFNMYGPREYVKRFQVVVNKDVRMSSAEVCVCPGIPKPFSTYSAYRALFPGIGFVGAPDTLQDANAYAIKIGAKRDRANDENEHRSYIVTVNYSTDMPEGGPPIPFGQMGLAFQPFGIQNQPWLFPPKLEWDSQEYTTAPMMDLDGRAYQNSADTPFLPSFTIQDAYHVLTVTRNEQDIDWNTNRMFYKFVVNNDTVKGYLPGYVLCMPARAQEQYIGEKLYWRVSYRLLCKDMRNRNGTRQPGWQPRILDAGLYQRGRLFGNILSPEVPVPIIRFGQSVNQPQLLNGSGVVQTARYTTGAAGRIGQLIPVFLDFREYNAVSLNVLLGSKGT